MHILKLLMLELLILSSGMIMYEDIKHQKITKGVLYLNLISILGSVIALIPICPSCYALLPVLVLAWLVVWRPTLTIEHRMLTIDTPYFFFVIIQTIILRYVFGVGMASSMVALALLVVGVIIFWLLNSDTRLKVPCMAILAPLIAHNFLLLLIR